jgi:hypothetical protein
VEQSKAKKVKRALALRSQGIGIRRIAREVGLGVGAVIRLVDQAPPAADGLCMSAPAVAARGQVGTARTMRIAVPAGIQPSHAHELSFAEREGHPTCGIFALLVIAIDVFERSFRCVAVVAVEGGAVHGYTPFPSTKQ